jgi:hypothetical protein
MEPLKVIGIYPHTANKKRITINKRRSQGFSVEAAALEKQIQDFLLKTGQSDAVGFKAPTNEFLIQNDDDTTMCSNIIKICT